MVPTITHLGSSSSHPLNPKSRVPRRTVDFFLGRETVLTDRDIALLAMKVIEADAGEPLQENDSSQKGARPPSTEGNGDMITRQDGLEQHQSKTSSVPAVPLDISNLTTVHDHTSSLRSCIMITRHRYALAS